MNFRKSYIIILCCLSSICLYGQTNAQVNFNTDSIRIGELFRMELVLTSDNNDSILDIWPEFDNYLTDDIEVIQKSKITETLIDSTKHIFSYQQLFNLTSFNIGAHVIPSFEFKLLDSTYSTEPYAVYVNTVEIDTSKGIFDIKPIFDINYSISARVSDWFKNYWYWFAIGALIILIFILWLRLKQKPSASIEVIKRIIPAHISALEILKSLLNDEAWKKENKKQYYSAVTDTIRKYLEERFEILAMEKTTIEIIKDLKYSDIISKDKFFLQEILQQADLVKFAKFKPENSDGEIVLGKSIEFVQRTKKEDDIVNKQNELNNGE